MPVLTAFGWAGSRKAPVAVLTIVGSAAGITNDKDDELERAELRWAAEKLEEIQKCDGKPLGALGDRDESSAGAVAVLAERRFWIVVVDGDGWTARYSHVLASGGVDRRPMGKSRSRPRR